MRPLVRRLFARIDTTRLLPIAAVVLCLLVLLPYLWPGGPTTTRYRPLLNANRDEGVVLFDALRVARGQVLYRDFFEFYGPVFTYLFGWMFKIAGASVTAARLLQNVVVAAGGACLAVVVARFAGRLAGLAAAVFYACALVPVWPYAYHHWLAQTFVLAALVPLSRPALRPRDEWLGGALLGCALASVQSLGLPALVAGAGAVALPGIAARDWRVALLGPARVLAGAAAALLPWVIFFAAHGALGDLVYCMFVWPFGHYAEGQKEASGYAAFAVEFARNQAVAGHPWRDLGAAVIYAIAALPLVAPVAALLAAPGIVAALRGRALGGVTVAAVATVVAVSLAAVTPMFAGGARNDLTHLAFVAAFGIVALAVGCHVAAGWRSAIGRAGTTALVTLAGASLLVHVHKTKVTWAASRRHATFADAFFAREMADAEVMRLVAAHTRPDDAIVAGSPLSGWNYWFADRRSAVSYTYIPYDPAQEGYFSEDMWLRLATEIAERRPRVLWLDAVEWRHIVGKRPDLRALYRRDRHPMLLWLIQPGG